MAQMASLLVVATVFVALWTLNIYILQSERGGGGLVHETKLPMQELEPKLQGGVFAGFYGTCTLGHCPICSHTCTQWRS